MSERMNRALKRIVLCSDDAGWDGANDAVILALARAGRISAVSVLVDGPAAPAWADRHTAPSWSFGLHLNFTWSAAEHSSGLGALLARAHLRRLHPGELDTRINAQLDQFESLYGCAPDFIDGHQHVHMLPQIRGVLLAALRARYGNDMPALRVPASAAWRGSKALALNLLGARALDRMAHGCPVNRDFAGVYDFGRTVPYRTRMQGWLSSIGDLGLIMAHPGSQGPLEHAAARATEAAYFNSADWPADLVASGCALVPFTARDMRG